MVSVEGRRTSQHILYNTQEQWLEKLKNYHYSVYPPKPKPKKVKVIEPVVEEQHLQPHLLEVKTEEIKTEKLSVEEKIDKILVLLENVNAFIYS